MSPYESGLIAKPLKIFSLLNNLFEMRSWIECICRIFETILYYRPRIMLECSMNIFDNLTRRGKIRGKFDEIVSTIDSQIYFVN